jgi:hypothetical protein
VTENCCCACSLLGLVSDLVRLVSSARLRSLWQRWHSVAGKVGDPSLVYLVAAPAEFRVGLRHRLHNLSPPLVRRLACYPQQDRSLW